MYTTIQDIFVFWDAWMQAREMIPRHHFAADDDSYKYIRMRQCFDRAMPAVFTTSFTTA